MGHLLIEKTKEYVEQKYSTEPLQVFIDKKEQN